MPLPPGLSQQDFDSARRGTARGRRRGVGIHQRYPHRDLPRPVLAAAGQRGRAQSLRRPWRRARSSTCRGCCGSRTSTGFPTWAFSTGKNFGYGGTETRVAGSVIIDLKRMNRIPGNWTRPTRRPSSNPASASTNCGRKSSAADSGSGSTGLRPLIRASSRSASNAASATASTANATGR